MKVVINRCYGGFSLSPEAALEVYKRGGDIEATPVEEYFGNRSEAKSALRRWRDYVADADKGEASHMIHVFSPDETKVLSERPRNRACPILVQVVEELGDKANGSYSKLRIVEIPDGVEWEIDDYDGMERVDEVHRSWG